MTFARNNLSNLIEGNEVGSLVDECITSATNRCDDVKIMDVILSRLIFFVAGYFRADIIVGFRLNIINISFLFN